MVYDSTKSASYIGKMFEYLNRSNGLGGKTDIKTEIDDATVCQCCLSQVNLRELSHTHTSSGEIRSYGSILNEIFPLISVSLPIEGKICRLCISYLVCSCQFKEQFAKAQFVLHGSTADRTSVIKEEIAEDDDVKGNNCIEECSIEDIKPEIDIKDSPNTEDPTSGVEGDPLANCMYSNFRVDCRSTSSQRSLNSPNFDRRIYRTKNNNKPTNARARRARTLLLCPHCDATFYRSQELQHHAFKNHEPDNLFICDICQWVHYQKSRLAVHMREVHLKIRNHKCEFCGKHYINSAKLKSHIVVHTGERNYTCEYCHKAFRRMRNLRQHVRIHQNIRNFLCPDCGQTFVQKASLNYHISKYHKSDYLI